MKPVSKLEDIPETGFSSLDFEGKPHIILKEKDAFYLIPDFCPHQGFPLSLGNREGSKLICASHGWVFNIADGQCENNADACLEVRTLRLVGNELFL